LALSESFWGQVMGKSAFANWISQEAAVKEIFNTQQGGVFRENKLKSHEIKYEQHNTHRRIHV
jgi:hypothetical protein